MALLTRFYVLVDEHAPPFWDPASASAFICILSVGVLGAAAAGGRLYGKFKLTKKFAWDDMFMLLAAVSSVSYTIMALLQVRYGLVVPMQQRPYEVQIEYEMINYAARVFYLTGLTWFKLSLCVTCHKMSNGRLETKIMVLATFAACSAIGITSIIALLQAFPPGAVEGVTLHVGILLQLMYGFISNNRYLNTVQRKHRRGWMYVTFATTFSSIIRAFTIAPATSIFSTESEALIVMGVLELNMGIISTSLPAWYMWMDISRKGKRKLRDYQPFRFLRRLLLPLTNPAQRLARENYYKFITTIEDKTSMWRIIQQVQRIQELPYYQMLYWNAEANPAEKVIGRQTRLYNIAFRFRRWFNITKADLSYRLRRISGLRKASFLPNEIEFELTGRNKEQMKDKLEQRPVNISEDENFDEVQFMEPLLKQQRESFLTNRNYNILFTSDKTLTDMMRDEELEYINSVQWNAFKDEGVDWKLRQNFASGQTHHLNSFLFSDNVTSSRVDGNLKGRCGRRRG
ncbi:hypothetical protein TWF730_003819 [Orbilia blumenaviensis]|uniref:Rhodopsin domain-containing protein n=1 Tax=Orbilia blumenaviensis TaxID=1796055 RepID=A0AAV9U0G1_9PEZI